jgi:hypothetical protein
MGNVQRSTTPSKCHIFFKQNYIACNSIPGTQRFKSLTEYIHQSQILSSLSIMAVCESTLSSIPYFLLCKECNSFLTSITPEHEMGASEKDGYGFLPNK